MVRSSLAKTPSVLAAGVALYIAPVLLYVTIAVGGFVIGVPALGLLSVLVLIPVHVWVLGKTSLVPVSVALDGRFRANWSRALRATRRRWLPVVARVVVVAVLAALISLPFGLFEPLLAAFSPALAAFGFVLVRTLTSLVASALNISSHVALLRSLSPAESRPAETQRMFAPPTL